MTSSRGSSQPRDQTCVSLLSLALAGMFFTTSVTWEACVCVCVCVCVCACVCMPYKKKIHLLSQFFLVK